MTWARWVSSSFVPRALTFIAAGVMPLGPCRVASGLGSLGRGCSARQSGNHAGGQGPFQFVQALVIRVMMLIDTAGD